MATPTSTKKIRLLTQFSLLLAIEIILGVTPLGIIMVGPVSITTMHIPVIIGAIVMGPFYGGLLGFSFGMISLIKAITSAVSAGDMLFSPALSGNPLASVFMCLVPRILLGVAAALLYRLLANRLKKQYVSVGISAVTATILHTLSVMACLYLFFKAVSLAQVFATILTLNGILELLVAAFVAVPVCVPLIRYNQK